MSVFAPFPTGEMPHEFVEAMNLASDLRVLQERIAGLPYTPKHLREEREKTLRAQVAEKLKAMKELKAKIDSIPVAE